MSYPAQDPMAPMRCIPPSLDRHPGAAAGKPKAKRKGAKAESDQEEE